MLDYLLQALEELKAEPRSIRGSLAFDPLGHVTVTGGFYRSEKEDMLQADKLLLAVENELPGFRVLPVSSYLFGNAGASAVQELAYGISMAAEYLTRLTDMGHDTGEIATHMQWNMGVGSNYFMEIAKVRAARLLFSRLLSAYDPVQATATSIYIHSITTDWNKTIFDPTVNMLRLTTEAMAAVIGGCNSLLVKPFDSWYREPGDLSERLSRNIQVILKEESYFNKVADPSAGSYFIESLTHSLAEHAWQLFLKTDGQGGYINAFRQGHIQEAIKQMYLQRKQMIASRREVLLGTNQYPNQQELIAEQVDEHIAFHSVQKSTEPVGEPLVSARGAVEFEKLRLATERHIAGRPRVFMLTCGNLAMRLARSQFSANFFACAGYEIIDNLGFSSAEEGSAAALKAKADIVVLCSSDEEYALLAPAAHEILKEKVLMVVAGAPACMEDLKHQGITDFIHIRSNVLETLQGYHQKLGINL
jgi:methylmalonyl-CoA mutase